MASTWSTPGMMGLLTEVMQKDDAQSEKTRERSLHLARKISFSYALFRHASVST